jgi:hypothetical protein
MWIQRGKMDPIRVNEIISRILGYEKWIEEYRYSELNHVKRNREYRMLSQEIRERNRATIVD